MHVLTETSVVDSVETSVKTLSERGIGIVVKKLGFIMDKLFRQPRLICRGRLGLPDTGLPAASDEVATQNSAHQGPQDTV